MERLTALPNRALVLAADRMEFAHSEAGTIFLVVMTPEVGAPADDTKQVWTATLDVLAEDGTVVSTAPRSTTFVIYDDPSGAIGTPEDYDPAAALMAFVLDFSTRAKAWAQRLAAPLPLWLQVAPTNP